MESINAHEKQPLHSHLYKDTITQSQDARLLQNPPLAPDGHLHSAEVYEQASNTGRLVDSGSAVWSNQATHWPRIGRTSSGISGHQSMPWHVGQTSTPHYIPHRSPQLIRFAGHETHARFQMNLQNTVENCRREDLRTPGILRTPPSHGIRHPYEQPDVCGRSIASAPSELSTTVKQVLDADSSSVACGSSAHMNRKKRKACGRCIPCQKKNNCGECMNCINRAKGKQICVYRKCEELKKKGPGSLFSSERKRSRTEESSCGSTQQRVTLQQPVHKFPVYTSYRHELKFDSSSTQCTTTALPAEDTSLHLITRSNELGILPSRQNSPGNATPHDTTDIISQALQQIDNDPETAHLGIEKTFLQTQPSFSPVAKEIGKDCYERHHQVSENLLPQQQWLSSLTIPVQQVVSTIDTHPSTLPIGSFPQHHYLSHQNNPFVSENVPALPDQILSNLTLFNEINSFQGNNKPSSPSCSSKGLPQAVQGQVSNYAEGCYSVADRYTISQTPAEVDSTVKTTCSEAFISPQDSKDSQSIARHNFACANRAMYHGQSTTSGSYAAPGSVPLANARIASPAVGAISSRIRHPTTQRGYVTTQSLSNLYCGVSYVPDGRQNPNEGIWQPPNFHQPDMTFGGLGVDPKRILSERGQYHVDTVAKQAFENNEFHSNQQLSTSGTGASFHRDVVVAGLNSRTRDLCPGRAQPQLTSGWPAPYLHQTSVEPNEAANPSAGFHAAHYSGDYGSIRYSAQNDPMHPEISYSSSSSAPLAATDSVTDQNSGMCRLPKSQLPLALSTNIGHNLRTENQFVSNSSSSPSRYEPHGEWPPLTGEVPFDAFSGKHIQFDVGKSKKDNAVPQNLNNKGMSYLCVTEACVPAADYHKSAATGDLLSPLSAHTSEIAPSPGQMSLRSMQSDSGNTVQVCVNPASETSITISPGESGYDSTEMLHTGEDLQERLKNSQSVSASYEAKKVMPDENHPGSLSDVHEKETSTWSKNLSRAPADDKAAHVIQHQPCRCNTGLPSAGACSNISYLQFGELPPEGAAARSTNYSTHAKRSSSCDGYVQNYDLEEKIPVKLRRYSLQEYVGKKSQTSDCALRHVEGHPGKAILSPFSLLQRRVDDALLVEDQHKFLCKEQYLCPSVSSPSSHFGMRVKTDTAYERRLMFDTPPMTPRSGESTTSKNSEACFFGTMRCNTSSLDPFLPTPPHYCDNKTHVAKPHGAMPGTNVLPGEQRNACDTLPVKCEESTPKIPLSQFESRVREDGTSESLRGYKTQVNNNKSTPQRTQFPKCSCIEGSDGTNDEAPYYTHLGAAENVLGIRELFEKRTGYLGPAIRLEKVVYTGKEGKTSRGCPIAKWIIRRSSEEEKLLIVCRQRPGHKCNTAVIVVIILMWDGVARPLADFAYTNYSTLIPKHGEPTERRCGTNDERTCACQGFKEATCGASFSFGCSWSMYYNGCKYARSNQPNKYKLTATKNAEAENFVGMLCERLATVMSPLYEMAAPDAFLNQVQYEDEGYECRLGENTTKNSRPFSGVTTCLDFCAHAHKDQHNMDNGSTVVVTFTKPELRTIGHKPEDEQLHVLPLYKLDLSDDESNFNCVSQRVSTGAIEVLRGFRREVRVRKEPRLSKKQKLKARKKSAVDDGYQLSGRRGRPPKRARSFENLLRRDSASPYEKLGLSPGQWKFQNNVGYAAEARLQKQSVGANIQSTLFKADALSGTPTRWPYRRQPSMSPACGITRPANGLCSPIAPNHVQESASERRSLSDQLPSIGSFFHENTVPSGSQASCTVHPASHLVPITPVWNKGTPLPSVQDVVSHPFHETFANVKTEFIDSSNLLEGISGRANETKINLKAYAAGSVHSAEYGVDDMSLNGSMHNFVRATSDADSNISYQERAAGLEQAPRGTEFVFSDSEENFINSDIGGVAIAPGHGSVLIECAKKELHATTPLLRPNRFSPSRISLVFYQHKNLNARNHGAAEYGAKEEKRQKQREERRQEEAMRIQEMEKNAAFPIVPCTLPQRPENLSNITPPSLRQATLGHIYSPGYAPLPNTNFYRGAFRLNLDSQGKRTCIPSNLLRGSTQLQNACMNNQIVTEREIADVHGRGVPPQHGSAAPRYCATTSRPSPHIIDLVRSRIGTPNVPHGTTAGVYDSMYRSQSLNWVSQTANYAAGNPALSAVQNLASGERKCVPWALPFHPCLPNLDTVTSTYYPNGTTSVYAGIPQQLYPPIKPSVSRVYRYPPSNLVHNSLPNSYASCSPASYPSDLACSRNIACVPPTRAVPSILAQQMQGRHHMEASFAPGHRSGHDQRNMAVQNETGQSWCSNLPNLA